MSTRERTKHNILPLLNCFDRMRFGDVEGGCKIYDVIISREGGGGGSDIRNMYITI
jgi:hypothetical protein